MKRRKRERKFKFSFKTSLFIYFVGFFAIVITALWLMQDVYVNNFNEYVKTDKARMTISTVERYIDSPNSDALIRAIASENAMCIEIIKISDDDTNKQTDTYGDADNCVLHTMSEKLKYELILKTNEHDGNMQAYYMRTNGMFDGTIYYDKLPFSEMGLPKDFVLCKKIDIGSEKCYILVNSTIAPLDAAVAVFRVQLGYLILGISLFFIIITIYITRRFSKPIERINTMAKNLVNANYNVHFDDSKSKELSELSETMNFVANELAQTEAIRKEFIANVSHDLRTPLTLIGGYAEAIKDMPDSTAESADVIIDEVKRLSKLVSDMLDLSVMQSGQYKPNFEELNITELISDIVNRLNKFHEKEGVKIDFNYSDSVIVRCDEVKISQVAYNLIINAIKFAGEDKNIIINQKVEVGNVKIEVIDHGRGIDSNILPHIFERYYKDKKTQIGTGLGLSIVKAIMELHGGNYGVNSELGKGSAFWFSLTI